MSSIPLHLSRRFTTSEMQEIIDVATRKSPASIEDSEPSLSELQDRLDTLWEKQLHLLDQYDQAQRQLQRHLSSVRPNTLDLIRNTLDLIYDDLEPNFNVCLGFLLPCPSKLQSPFACQIWTRLLR